MRKLYCLGNLVLCFLFTKGITFSQPSKVDSLEALLQTTLADNQKIDVLIDLTDLMQYQNPEKGIIYGEQALDLAQLLFDTVRMAGALSRMGGCYSNLGELDQAESTWRQTLALEVAINDSLGIARQYNNLGSIFDSRGALDSAIIYYETGLAIFTRLKHNFYQAIILNNLAIIYERTAEYPKAIDFYLRALTIFEKEAHKGGIGAVYANLGNVYYRIKAYQDAISYFQRSLKIKEEIKDIYGIAINYSNLGSLYLDLEKLDSAKIFEEQALDLRQQIGDQMGESVSNINLGIIHYQLENYRLGLDFLQKAYHIAKKLGNQPELAKAALHLGKTYFQLGQLNRADKYLLEAYKLADQTEERETKLGVYKGLYELYKKRNDTRGFKFFEHYVALNDSIRKDEKIREITQLELKYQFDKEKEVLKIEREQKEQLLQSQLQRQRVIRNASLGGLLAGLLITGLLWRGFQQKQKSNRLLELQKDTIQQTLEERESLLKEIHHRVKNNLQVVSSLLSLQSRSIEDPLALGAIEEGRNRVKAMALIHQNLYQEENLVGVDLPVYIHKLADSLIHSYKLDHRQIEISHKIAPISLDVDTLIPLALILNELISNSLKYAFTGQEVGKINIEIDEAADGLKVVVSDNGIGLPSGFQPEQANSLGFKLIRSFVNKMKAQLEILSKGGTHISIFLPKLKG